jgi:hypothetical protein
VLPKKSPKAGTIKFNAFLGKTRGSKCTGSTSGTTAATNASGQLNNNVISGGAITSNSNTSTSTSRKSGIFNLSNNGKKEKLMINSLLERLNYYKKALDCKNVELNKHKTFIQSL